MIFIQRTSSYVHAKAAFLDPGRCTDVNLMEPILTVFQVTKGDRQSNEAS